MKKNEIKAMEYLENIGLNYDDDRNKYGMLSRLQSDCDYYLGFGNRSTRSLWANSEQEHIEIMKNLYMSFPDDKKPKWISMEKINEYEKEMIVVSEEIIQNNKEVVLEAVENSGEALQWASEKLKNDKEVVLEAVNKNVEALKFASEELQKQYNGKNFDIPPLTSIKENAQRATDKVNANKSTAQRNKDKGISR